LELVITQMIDFFEGPQAAGDLFQSVKVGVSTLPYLIEMLFNNISSRDFIIFEDGACTFVTLTTTSIKPGDCLALFYDAQSPFLIRHTGPGDSYVLVAPIRLHGIDEARLEEDKKRHKTSN
jgi:hypothetical protein